MTATATTATTASAVRAGDFLHRVRPLPLSAVFTAPVDARVVAVEPFGHAGEAYVRIHLADDGVARGRLLNLRTDREVTLTV